MKKYIVLAAILAGLSASASAGCTFQWYHYGEPAVFNLIKNEIGEKVTDLYCAKYNKTSEIVIITNEYSDTERTLVHVIAGLRKRGSNAIPQSRRTAYQFENGNFVLGKGYQMSARLALDMVMDVMSSLDKFAP
ncbi:hypothetical protein Ga0061063_2554 [Gulbenkiania indica]|uniref:Lipoprotein n=1 Tax=Gulbenkiania indica TaxID=375574 RepID=A0A0K6H5K6_9NEIS|nr:hypothetical protein [Gulbenkiania indica]CUA86025.1 hypothetical protein Ga0061063_2554 [Gulbenkiania indica]